MKPVISVAILLLTHCSCLFAQTGAEPTTLKTVHVGMRDELLRAVRNANAGTKILIAPGTYRGGLNFIRLRGTKNKPIVLAASDQKRMP